MSIFDKKGKKSVQDIQHADTVELVQTRIKKVETDVPYVAQKIMGLGKKPLDDKVIGEVDKRHREIYRESVSDMRQGFANSANHATNQLTDIYKQRATIQKDLERIPQRFFIKDETGRKQWTIRDRIIFLLFVIAALSFIGAAASLIDAVAISIPSLSAHPFRAWCFGVFGSLVGASSLYWIDYSLNQYSEKAAKAYFLIMKIAGGLAAISLVFAVAKIGLGVGNQSVSLDFTAASAVASDGESSSDFLIVFSEALGEFIAAFVCIKAAAEKHREHGGRDVVKENLDYVRVANQLAELNRTVSDWESKVADNQALLKLIADGEEKFSERANALLKARYYQHRLSFGLLD